MPGAAAQASRLTVNRVAATLDGIRLLLELNLKPLPLPVVIPQVSCVINLCSPYLMLTIISRPTSDLKAES